MIIDVMVLVTPRVRHEIAWILGPRRVSGRQAALVADADEALSRAGYPGQDPGTGTCQ